MKILAIMQNQWFNDPPRMEKMLRETFKGDRPRFIRTFLFWSCRTGKVLKATFGEDLCDSIVWEEASPKIGGSASSSFSADVGHIRRVIAEQKPDLIIAFGKIAWDGLSGAIATDGLFEDWVDDKGQTPAVLKAPHPCARGADVAGQLRAVAAAVKIAMIGKAAKC